MSKNGKTDCLDGNNIQWFQNYEKRSKTKHLEKLKNVDILNYIKDIEQNCRLEVSSGDEDYAGTKRSSNCSVKYSERKTKRSSGHYAKDACNYCSSTRRFYFRGSPDVRENSRRDPNTSTKTIRQRSNLSRNSYKYRASSPTFHDRYSREDRKAWPRVTTSAEIIKDYQNAIDSKNNKSKITDRKPIKVRTFKLLRRRKLSDSTYVDPRIAPNEKTTERDPPFRVRKQRDETWIRKLNEEIDVSGSVNQQPFNKIYSDRDMAFSYYTPLENGEYKGSYTSRYPVRSSKKPTWGLSSRSNRLTARSPKTIPLLQDRTLQCKDEVEPQLKAFGSIMGAISIDRNYQRETKCKNNIDQRRQGPDILGEQESLCYCKPGLLREFGKLSKVVRSREDKQRLGCEDVERDETADCSRYCQENVNDLTRLQYESIRRPIPMNRRFNYTATLRRTLSELLQPLDYDEDESEINLSIEKDSQNEGSAYYNYALDDDDARTNTYDDAVDLEYLKPYVSFPGVQARRGSREVARKYKKLSNDLKSNQGKAMGARTTLREKITARYPKGKEFFYAIKTLGKPVMGDSSGLRYAEDTCECHDTSAAYLTASSCTSIGNDEYEERNDSYSSRSIFDTVYYSSSISHDEMDPVKKLESCVRVNCNATKFNDSDGQIQSEFGRRVRPAETEQLADSARPRLEKSRHRHGEANLETILIYPPQEEGGPPLMLFKRSSNISCRVKGDADTGFRYSVTYVQKFVSPTWMSSLAPRVPSWETDVGYVRSAGYG